MDMKQVSGQTAVAVAVSVMPLFCHILVEGDTVGLRWVGRPRMVLR